MNSTLRGAPLEHARDSLHGAPLVDLRRRLNRLTEMTEAALIGLKQQLFQLTENERQEVSAFLLRLGRETDEWKRETARRLQQMVAGEQTSVDELRARLGHGE